jgi:hypothetical protein
MATVIGGTSTYARQQEWRQDPALQYNVVSRKVYSHQRSTGWRVWYCRPSLLFSLPDPTQPPTTIHHPPSTPITNTNTNYPQRLPRNPTQQGSPVQPAPLHSQPSRPPSPCLVLLLSYTKRNHQGNWIFSPHAKKCNQVTNKNAQLSQAK